MPPFHSVVSKALKRFEHVSFFFIFLLFLAFFLQLLLRFFVQCFSAYFLFIMTKGSSRNAFEVLCRRQRAGEREKGQAERASLPRALCIGLGMRCAFFVSASATDQVQLADSAVFSVFFIFLLLLLVLPSFSASFSASACACCFGFSFVLAVWLCG